MCSQMPNACLEAPVSGCKMMELSQAVSYSFHMLQTDQFLEEIAFKLTIERSYSYCLRIKHVSESSGISRNVLESSSFLVEGHLKSLATECEMSSYMIDLSQTLT